MRREKGTERCIYCDELIRKEAQFCKHCGNDLEKPKKKKSALKKFMRKQDNFNTGAIVGCIVTVVIILVLRNYNWW